MLDISDKDFIRLVAFVKSNYGIDLSKKKQLIVGRLSNTILARGYSSFHDYIDDIIGKKSAEDISLLLSRLTTNYTYFMRESAHFDFFQSTILPYLERTKKNRVLSIWSAGCSTGEEPYTLSILLKEYFSSKAPGWDTRILATDISPDVLATAKKAQYMEESLSRLPQSWVRKYFRQISSDGVYEVTPELKNNVIFRQFNLMDPIQFRLKFDVIFCRNVMIYFDAPTKNQLVNRFYNATVPGGYLLIGHSESLDRSSTSYQYLQPAIYRKKLDNLG